ncbi:hypothetical protein ABKN59_000940 [Abortiporus biennis]
MSSYWWFPQFSRHLILSALLLKILRIGSQSTRRHSRACLQTAHILHRHRCRSVLYEYSIWYIWFVSVGS